MRKAVLAACLPLLGLTHAQIPEPKEPTVAEKISRLTQVIKNNFDQRKTIVLYTKPNQIEIYSKTMHISDRYATVSLGSDTFGESFFRVNVHPTANYEGVVFVDLGHPGLSENKDKGDYVLRTELKDGKEYNKKVFDFKDQYFTSDLVLEYENVINDLLQSYDLNRKGNLEELFLEEKQ